MRSIVVFTATLRRPPNETSRSRTGSYASAPRWSTGSNVLLTLLHALPSQNHVSRTRMLIGVSPPYRITPPRVKSLAIAERDRAGGPAGSRVHVDPSHAHESANAAAFTP